MSISTVSRSTAASAPTFAQGSDRPQDKINRRVLDLMRGALEEAKKAENKEIIAVVGNTGTGKSTLINHLYGVAMKKEGRKIEAKDPSQEKAKIGHRPATSETLYTHIYQAGSMAYADCGGFLETRGAENQIAVVSSIKFTLEHSKGVSLLLGYNIHGLMSASDRGVAFAQLVRTALQELLKKFQDYTQSIAVVFTKGDGMYSKAEVLEQLKGMYDDIADPTLKEMYGFLLRENGRFICVYNPLDEQSKTELVTLLQEMKPIKDTKGAFKIAYSSDSKIQLLEQMSAIAAIGNEVYDDYLYTSQAIQRYLQELGTLEGKIATIEAAIKQLGNGEADPDKIEALEKQLMKEHQKLIDEQKQAIARIESEKEPFKKTRVEAETKIKDLDANGTQEVSYWTDAIDQEGINIVSRTTNTVEKSSSGIFRIGASSSKTTSVTETVDKRSISRDFNYRGPKFSKVVKNPPEGSACWSNEQKTDTSFSVHYESGKGEPGKASLEVFVQKQYLPQQLVEQAELAREIGKQNEQLSRLDSEIQRCNKQIHDAELAMSQKGSVIERLEGFKTHLAELKKSHADLTQQRLAEEEKNNKVSQTLKEEMPNFVFLKDYLTISEDKELAQQETIKRFLQKDTQYHESI